MQFLDTYGDLIMHISDPLEAIFDVWLVGDKTLDRTWQAYLDMETKARKKTGYQEAAEGIVLPYAFEFYNVFKYIQLGSSGIRSMLARIINTLVEGLNQRPWLPRFVIVILDKDLIDEAGVFTLEDEVLETFTEMVNWLARQINIKIKRKHLNISHKNPGAVFGEDPRVIFVKMLRRAEFYPASCRLGKICSVRTKFNECLNSAAAEFDQYIMNITACTEKRHFDVLGNLSESGKQVFWRDLDHLLERFDRNDIQLLPTMARRNSMKYNKKKTNYGNNQY